MSEKALVPDVEGVETVLAGEDLDFSATWVVF